MSYIRVLPLGISIGFSSIPKAGASPAMFMTKTEAETIKQALEELAQACDKVKGLTLKGYGGGYGPNSPNLGSLFSFESCGDFHAVVEWLDALVANGEGRMKKKDAAPAPELNLGNIVNIGY